MHEHKETDRQKEKKHDKRIKCKDIKKLFIKRSCE